MPMINGTPGDDVLNGTLGIDTIVGGQGDDTLFGDADDDSLQGGPGADQIDGGVGNDWADGGRGDDTVQGGDGDDTLLGGSGADHLWGNAGRDSLIGGAGNDLLGGGFDDDVLLGGNGQDTLVGGPGNDTLGGGQGPDDLSGGSGDDSLNGGAGDDVVDGGEGNDMFVWTPGASMDNADRYRGGPGVDTTRVALTRDEWLSPVIQQQLALWLQHLDATPRNALGQIDAGLRNDHTLTLPGRAVLTASMMEGFVVSVDGTAVEMLAPTLRGGDLRADVRGSPGDNGLLTDLGAFSFFDLQWGDAHAVTATPLDASLGGALEARIIDAATGDGQGTVLWTYRIDPNGAVPTAGGTERFRIDVIDAGGRVAGVEVVAVVAAANLAPAVDDSRLALPAGRPVEGRLAATDADGDALVFSVADAPAHGVLHLQADGRFVYTPVDGFVGEDGFRIGVADGRGGVTTGKVAVDVGPSDAAAQVGVLVEPASFDALMGVGSPGDAAALAGGGHVVTWYDGQSVLARVHDAAGAAAGPVILVGSGYIPEAVGLADGGFVIARAMVSAGGRPVQVLQRFDAAGKAVDAAFSLGPTVNVGPAHLSMTGLPDGGFVAAWWLPGRDNRVLMRRFDDDGLPTSAPVDVSTVPAASAGGHVAALPDGGWVVAWSTPIGTGRDPDHVLHLRLHDSAGRQVRETTWTVTDPLRGLDLDAVSDGFVLTTGLSDRSVLQRFDAGGSAVGDPLTVAGADAFAAVRQDGAVAVVVPSVGPYHYSRVQGYTLHWYDAQGDAVGPPRALQGPHAGLWPREDSGTPWDMAWRSDSELVVVYGGPRGVWQQVVAVADDGPVLPATSALTGGHPVTLDEGGRTGALSSDERQLRALGTAGADGGYTFAWADRERGELAAQRWHADGTPDGPAWRLNDAYDEYWGLWSLAFGSDGHGHEVVAWKPWLEDRIFLQRVGAAPDEQPFVLTTLADRWWDSDGSLSLAPVGDALAVAWTTGSRVEMARVVVTDSGLVMPGDPVDLGTARGGVKLAALADGRTAVMWERGALWSDRAQLVVQLVGTDGSVEGAVKVVGATTTDRAMIQTAIAPLGEGFVVSWLEVERDVSQSLGLMVQRVGADGQALGPATLVSDLSRNDTTYDATVVADGHGGYVAFWTTAAVLGSSLDLLGRRFAADGTPYGGEFVVVSPDESLSWAHDRVSEVAAVTLPSGAIVVSYVDGPLDAARYRVIDDFATDTVPVAELLARDDNEMVLVSVASPDARLVAQVAARPDGGWWLAWTGHGDDGGADVSLQRYGADGTPQGDPVVFQRERRLPLSLSAGEDGSAWLAWAASSETGVGAFWAQVGPDGVVRHAPQSVVPDQWAYAKDAFVQSDPLGGATVYWISAGFGHDPRAYLVHARRIGPDGEPAGPPTTVVGPSVGDSAFSASTAGAPLARLADGRTVIVHGDGASQWVSFVRADGSAGGDVALSGVSMPLSRVDDVAAHGDGFVVVGAGPRIPGHVDGIVAQRYDAAGVPVGDVEPVSTWAWPHQYGASAGESGGAAELPAEAVVEALADGGFVVLWQTGSAVAPGLFDVHGQRFGPDGARIGGNFVVNDAQVPHVRGFAAEDHPTASLGADGSLVVVWSEGARLVARRITDLDAAAAPARQFLGGPGADSVVGTAQADVLDGGAGDDRLDGAHGADRLTGGPGADAFVFSAAPRAGIADRLSDFTPAVDHLVFDDREGAWNLRGSGHGPQAFDILGDAQAASAATRWVYDPIAGALAFDPDGAGPQPATTVAWLTGAPALSALDIMVLG